MAHFVLKLPDVMKRTGLSSSTIYRGIAAGTFPPQVKLSQRSVGWTETSIDDWIEDRLSTARPQHHGDANG